MGFVEAFVYFTISYFFLPKSRDEIPFKTFGFDLDQLVLYMVEAGFDWAVAVELYKGFVCLLDPEYGASEHWCPPSLELEPASNAEPEEESNDEKPNKKSSKALYSLLPLVY